MIDSRRTKLQSNKRSLRSGIFILLWSAFFSGALMEQKATVYLGIHIVTSSGVLAALLVFLRQHWWQRRQKIHTHANARYGLIAVICLTLLLISGVSLLRWTNVPQLRWVHAGSAWLLVFDLGWHVAWQLRQRRVNVSSRQQPLVQWLSYGGVVAFLLLMGTSSLIGAREVASTSVSSVAPVPVAHSTEGQHKLYTSQQCAACHSDISEQWQTTAHANAATDPYYQALTAMFIQERGIESARYCAACHNPVGLVNGEIAFDALPSEGDAANAYDARSLGVQLSMSHAATDGVSCVMCHLANDAPTDPHSGPLVLARASQPLPEETLNKLALRAAPDGHSALMSRDLLQQAEQCGSCHNLHTPDGFKVEPTYDEWLASDYPAQGVTCQSCHMPLVSGQRVDSALVSQIAAHGGLPGAPSSLPAMSNATDLLQTAITLDGELISAETSPILNLTITNSGAGHYFPTGADDLRQVWLEIIAYDAAGAVVWQQGVVDERGRITDDVIRFGKTLGDAQNRPIPLHRFWLATQIIADTRLAPHETRALTVPIPVATPDQLAALKIRVLYRDVSPQFAEFALDKAVDDLPIFEVATRQIDR